MCDERGPGVQHPDHPVELTPANIDHIQFDDFTEFTHFAERTDHIETKRGWKTLAFDVFPLYVWGHRTRKGVTLNVGQIERMDVHEPGYLDPVALDGALVVFCRADPEDYDPSFKIPDVLYPAVPILGVLLTVVVISRMAGVIILLGMGVVGLGVGWYFVYVGDHAIDRAYRRCDLPDSRCVSSRRSGRKPGDTSRFASTRSSTARARADERTPELVAVNVLRIAEPSPEQNVAAERLEHQRDLLEAAREIATVDGTVPTLLNVQQPVRDGESAAVERGEQ